MNEDILIVTDPDTESGDIKAALRQIFVVTESALMSDPVEDPGKYPVMVVNIDLKDRKKVDRFREVYPRGEFKHCARLFIIERGCRADSVQAANLRARETMTRPVDARKLHRMICEFSDSYRHLLNKKPSVVLGASQEGLECLGLISNAVKKGDKIRKSEVSRSAQEICDAVVQGGALEWLSAVNNHHSYSYRHSLHVAGLMIAFADHLKFNNRDRVRMVVGALMHDLGKSKLPLRLLDKKGMLTPEERSIFRSHPILGHEILKNDGQWDKLTIDLVYQHHEYLDGSGYPNGLSASQIVDPVRMLTIVDIFSALVDKRAYKEEYTPEQAMRTLYAMTGKIDMALVRAFEPVGMKVIGDIKGLLLAA